MKERLDALDWDFEMDVAVCEKSRSRADFVFRTAKIAVFVDGCFWHGCPIHGTSPKNNAEWWAAKLQMNRDRDCKAVAAMQAAGWTVLRFWAHTPTAEAVDVIGAALSQSNASATKNGC